MAGRSVTATAIAVDAAAGVAGLTVGVADIAGSVGGATINLVVMTLPAVRCGAAQQALPRPHAHWQLIMAD